MKKFVTLLFVAVSTISITFAGNQGPVTATLDEHMKIVLPTDQPMAQEYVIDIAGRFVSAEVLNSFCDSFRDQGVSYRGDFAAGKMYISVTPLTDSTNHTWDAAKWNEYFSSRSFKMEYFMQSMNK